MIEPDPMLDRSRLPTDSSDQSIFVRWSPVSFQLTLLALTLLHPSVTPTNRVTVSACLSFSLALSGTILWLPPIRRYGPIAMLTLVGTVALLAMLFTVDPPNFKGPLGEFLARVLPRHDAVFGMAIQSNALAYLAVPAVTTAAAFAITAEKRSVGAAWSLLALSASIVPGAAGSRASFLGIAAGVGLCALMRAGLKGWVAMLAIVGATALVAGTFAAVASSTSDPSVDVRVDAWAEAVADFRHEPLFGTGVGTFERVHTARNAHNVLGQLAADYGLIGLVGFALSWMASATAALTNARASQPRIRAVALASLAGLAGYLMTGMFESVIETDVQARLMYYVVSPLQFVMFAAVLGRRGPRDDANTPVGQHR